MTQTKHPRKTVYLDYAATTPVDTRVIEAMRPYLDSMYGNPSSLHFAGRQARRALERARETFARGLNAQPNEVIFTGGGSEADNQALISVAEAKQNQGKHIVTTPIEHHAVLASCEYLETRGFEVTYLPVDSEGLVHPEDLKRALRPDTILVSVMHANNEIGTIEPIAELAALTRERNILFHTDAVQTGGILRIDVQELGVDLLTLSAHKFYGPKGIGVLFVRQGTKIRPLIHGGEQEHHLRAGTENTAGIIGAAKAFELALEAQEQEATRLIALRDDLWRRIQSKVENVRLNGHLTRRLPNNLNCSFYQTEAEGLLLHLSRNGVAASMGSACTSQSIEPSHVIQAIGTLPEWKRGTLRFSLGRFTTADDIAYAGEMITQLATEL